MMKILLVHIGDILLCPPVMNLINMLGDMRVEMILISTKSKYVPEKEKNLTWKVLPFEYEKDRSLLHKIMNLPKIRHALWEEIDKNYDEETVIWLTSNIDLKHLGRRIVKFRYILQLMELSEHLRYHNRIPYGLDPHTIGENALAVVVPEYNRAHIIKAWWDLSETPLVLSNKPYNDIKIHKNSEISDETASKIIKKIEGKKIILYQGIMHKERPLDKFIEAVDSLGDKYVFVVMSGGEDIYKNNGFNNYCFIPYVKAPYHLEITSHAYIGVLSYYPTKQSEYSILNAVFCAPNKSYEYAMFGLIEYGDFFYGGTKAHRKDLGKKNDFPDNV